MAISSKISPRLRTWRSFWPARRSWAKVGTARAAAPLFIALAVCSSTFAADNYKLGDDSMPHENIPHGAITHAKWESKIFPGTTRDYWIYVPKQYDGKTPACLMVFQDGGSYIGSNGQFRATTVF